MNAAAWSAAISEFCHDIKLLDSPVCKKKKKKHAIKRNKGIQTIFNDSVQKRWNVRAVKKVSTCFFLQLFLASGALPW